MSKPIQAKDLHYGQKFYTGRDGNTYHRIRPNAVSAVRLPDNEVFGIDQDYHLESFPLESAVYPMTESKRLVS